MREFIERLTNLGYSPSDAHSTCHSFIKEFNMAELENFIKSLESEVRVCGFNTTQTQ